MNWGLIIKPLAEADIEEAQAWYEGQREGLGDEFLQELEGSLSRVCSAPEAHAMIHKNVRRALLRRFPFGVFYRVEEATVVVLAVKHHKQHPRSWKRRS